MFVCDDWLNESLNLKKYCVGRRRQAITEVTGQSGCGQLEAQLIEGRKVPVNQLQAIVSSGLSQSGGGGLGDVCACVW